MPSNREKWCAKHKWNATFPFVSCVQGPLSELAIMLFWCHRFATCVGVVPETLELMFIKEHHRTEDRVMKNISTANHHHQLCGLRTGLALTGLGFVSHLEHINRLYCSLIFFFQFFAAVWNYNSYPETTKMLVRFRKRWFDSITMLNTIYSTIFPVFFPQVRQLWRYTKTCLVRSNDVTWPTPTHHTVISDCAFILSKNVSRSHQTFCAVRSFSAIFLHQHWYPRCNCSSIAERISFKHKASGHICTLETLGSELWACTKLLQRDEWSKTRVYVLRKTSELKVHLTRLRSRLRVGSVWTDEEIFREETSELKVSPTLTLTHRTLPVQHQTWKDTQLASEHSSWKRPKRN